MRSLILFPSLLTLASAHFELRYPKSIGFKDDNEDQAPCGGFTPDLTKDLVDFHVGGEAIAVRLTHQQSNWLFRVTLDDKAESGWEQVFPIVQQSGLGDFCEPSVTLPESYVGKKGVVSVVSSAVDGLLYQCIAANFVSGSATAPSECRNASSVKVSFTDDDKLTALVDGGSSSNSSTANTTSASATTAAPTASRTANAAATLQALGQMGLGNALTVASMVFVGALLI